MNAVWDCQFKNKPNKITVGQKFILLCKGDSKFKLKEPLHIVSSQQKNYDLYILKTLQNNQQFLALQATSYRAGTFDREFTISDGTHNILINNMSFNVQSVLAKTKKTISTYQSFGPFQAKTPLKYVTLITLSLSVTLFFIFIFIYRLFKHKSFLNTVAKRQTALSPAQSFILNLRKQHIQSLKDLLHTETLFKTFLEDHFKIVSINKSKQQIINNIKKYHEYINKKQLETLQQALNEFAMLQASPYHHKNAIALKDLCVKTVLFLDSIKVQK